MGATGHPFVVLATLVALLVAGFDAAAAARPCDDADAIRLRPSAVGRPWECCDWAEMDPTARPARWRCNDVVDKCSAECHDCEEQEDGGGYVCGDWVIRLVEPPVCTPRPWDCCDLPFCNKRLPPTCSCTDEVESCPSNCKSCELVQADPPRYRCLDSFDGFPGPSCSIPSMGKSN